ncbi:MAG TPA: signal peptidase I [Nocardioides sp.]|nr:signal peptidase I [Nocardioides sp.]
MTDEHRTTRTVVHRLVGHVVSLVLVLFTLLGVAYIVPAFLGYDRYVITGDSMSGTIEKGSLVLERPTPVDELAEGDVITYQPPANSGVGNLVTHRVTEVGRDAQGRVVLQTKGDANADPDPWLFSLTDPEQPVVEVTVPYAGWVFIALADRETRMLVVGVPAALIALLSLGQLAAALHPRAQPRPRHDVGVVTTASGPR